MTDRYYAACCQTDFPCPSDRDEIGERTRRMCAMAEQTITKVDGWGNIARYEAIGDSTYDIIRKTAEILQMDLSQ